jgi:hypothetical protein
VAGAFIYLSEGWSLYLPQRRLEPLFTSIEKTEVSSEISTILKS